MELYDKQRELLNIFNEDTNGHFALENAIAALNLPKSREVITTPFTFASTTHAIVRNGLVPIFCDVNEQDYTIDVHKIEALITDPTVPLPSYRSMFTVISAMWRQLATLRSSTA